MRGLLTRSINPSDAPGLSGDTIAVTSMVSVSASAGNTGLGRLKVSFSLPVLVFQADEDGFAASVVLNTPEIAAASLSRLILSPSRQLAAAKRIARSISTAPLLQPASTTPGVDLALAIRAPARSGSTVRFMVCKQLRSSSQLTERLIRTSSSSCPWRLLYSKRFV